MKDFIFLVSEIAKGKSVIRATLNYRLKKELLKGKILDLGSGGDDRYSTFIPREENSTYELLDVKQGAVVDFETDALPYKDDTFDTVVLLNVLEHLFNYNTILKEVVRIKKEGGEFIGYVPFLMWYHADPHDYFRYTHESLARILTEAGFKNIVIEKIYRGPYTSAFQMIHPTLPVFLRPFVFGLLYPLDSLFRKVRAKGAERYVLGYYFKAS